ncbi:carbohydrate-binding module 1 protein [Ancistrocladus abbreviatus]
MAINKFLFYNVLFGMLLINFASIEAAPQNALINYLPGFKGTFPSKHYSGYVTIEGKNAGKPKNLFYYFVVSERDASKDPVVLWLNGGPGCSSFDGFVYEHGPFNFRAGKTKNSLPTLLLNPHRWSKVSSIIYLDSPAGVGLSYSENETSYTTGDLETATDTHAFLLKWFEQFPEFIQNPFYMSGESYAGIYVPTLATKVAEGIKAGIQPIINFKGYMIGNGIVAEGKIEANSLVPFAHGMALISDDLYKNFTGACGVYYSDNTSDDCMKYKQKVYQALKHLNTYDILEPCYHSPDKELDTNSSVLPDSFRQLGKTAARNLPVRKRMFGRAWPYQMVVKDGLIPSWPRLNSPPYRGVEVPCTNDEVAAAWLNNKSVREAIHAQSESRIGAWALCMDIEYYHDAGGMMKYHKNLTAQGYRALIYSGDHDMCVPYTGTEAWTSSMGYKIVDEWRPWMLNNQVAGYLQGYENDFTFLTIKGAGHTVPEYKPGESLAFYSRWLQGIPI